MASMTSTIADDVFDVLYKHDLLEENHRQHFCKFQQMPCANQSGYPLIGPKFEAFVWRKGNTGWMVDGFSTEVTKEVNDDLMEIFVENCGVMDDIEKEQEDSVIVLVISPNRTHARTVSREIHRALKFAFSDIRNALDPDGHPDGESAQDSAIDKIANQEVALMIGSMGDPDGSLTIRALETGDPADAILNDGNKARIDP